MVTSVSRFLPLVCVCVCVCVSQVDFLKGLMPRHGLHRYFFVLHTRTHTRARAHTHTHTSMHMYINICIRDMYFSCTCPMCMYIPRVLAFLSHATSSRYKQCGAFSSSSNSIAMKAELFCVDKHDTLRLHHLLRGISLHASHHHYVYHIIIA